MKTKRKFKEADYKATEEVEIKLGDALPTDHLARYIVTVVGLLELSEIYGKYGDRGGKPYAPEVLLGLLLYGYATGTYSSRGIERGTYEQIPYRYISGNMNPDHDTLNEFRRKNLEELKGLFVQVLLMAHMMGYLKLGNISVDGTKVHADASKSKAVSYGRIGPMEERLTKEIERLFRLAEEADGRGDDFDIDNEIQRRKSKLTNLTQAKAILDARAAERDAIAEAEYQEKLKARQEKEERTGKKSRGRKPKPPQRGPREKDQYNFTDPDSRIMKNGNKKGFEQCYNGQAAVDQASRLIVGNILSNRPNDKLEALPVVDAIPQELGRPDAAALDNGYMSATNINGLEEMGITPYIATGRDSHHFELDSLFMDEVEPPPEDANHIVQMIYALNTEVGKAIYKLRKSTVEPVFGIIKEVMGFRQFSLRGLAAAAGEWNLVCLAYNLKRLHVLGPLV